MANDVANVFGGQVSVVKGADLANKLADSSQKGARGGIDGDYLNFSGKKGVYVIGKEQRQIQPDEIWAVNIASFEDGYVCWKGGSPAGIRMSNIFTGVPVSAPDPEEGGPFNTNNGEGWHTAKSMTLRSLDNDQQGYFRINSKSGVSAFADLQKEVAERSAGGMACWPLLKLEVGTFVAQGNKNALPVFNIVGWLNDEQIVTLAEPDVDYDALIDAAIDENSDTGAAAEPEPAPEPVTTGRRRRSL